MERRRPQRLSRHRASEVACPALARRPCSGRWRKSRPRGDDAPGIVRAALRGRLPPGDPVIIAYTDKGLGIYGCCRKGYAMAKTTGGLTLLRLNKVISGCGSEKAMVAP